MLYANRKQKDKLFYALFSEKENALSLYNAVSGTSYTDIENLEIVTLEDVLYLTMRNDMALCFHDDLDLFRASRPAKIQTCLCGDYCILPESMKGGWLLMK